ncbi:MAG: hypothetical protein K1X57_11410 [Gemmataceae bacterium]|nr:hypothetical protein [Gemmataceae bacterium]
MILSLLMMVAVADDPVGPAPPWEKPPVQRTEQDDPETLRRRGEQAMKAAEEQLRKRKLADGATKEQRQAIEDLDKLLKALQMPPSNSGAGGQPPPNSAAQPPGNSPDDSRQQQSGGRQIGGGSRTNQRPPDSLPQAGGGSAGRERQKNEQSPGASPQGSGKARERRGNRSQNTNNDAGRDPAQGKASPNGPPMPNAASGDRPGDADGNPGANPDQARGAKMARPRDGAPDTLGELSRDVWGHLPESLRQEVDHYYKERFMPRYQELIRQYYSKLAEAERAGPKK